MTTTLAPTSFKRGIIVKSFNINSQAEMADVSYSLRCTCGHQEVFQERPSACPSCSCETNKEAFSNDCPFVSALQYMHDEHYHYIEHRNNEAYPKATILMAHEDVRNFDDEDALSFVYIASQYFFDTRSKRITSTRFKRRVRYDKLNGRLYVIGGGVRDHSYLPATIISDVNSRFTKFTVHSTEEQQEHYDSTFSEFETLVRSYVRLPLWMSTRLEKERIFLESPLYLIPIALLPLGIELHLNLSTRFFVDSNFNPGPVQTSFYYHVDLDLIRFTRNHVSLKAAFDALLKVDSSYFLKVLMRHKGTDAENLIQVAHRLAGAFKDSNHFNSVIDAYSGLLLKNKEVSNYVHLKKLPTSPDKLLGIETKKHSAHSLDMMIKCMNNTFNADADVLRDFHTYFNSLYYLSNIHPTNFGNFSDIVGIFGKFKRLFNLSDKRLAQLLRNDFDFLRDLILASNTPDFNHLERTSAIHLISDIMLLGKSIKKQYPDFKFGKFTTFHQLHERLIRVTNRLYINHVDFELKNRFKKMTGTFGALTFDIADSNTRLSDIGKSLQICVGSYESLVMEHEQYIFYAHCDDQYALCISVSPRNKGILQVKGFRNYCGHSIPVEWIDSVHQWASEYGLTITTNDMSALYQDSSQFELPLMPISFDSQQNIHYSLEEIGDVFDLSTDSHAVQLPEHFVLNKPDDFYSSIYLQNTNRLMLLEDALFLLRDISKRYLPGYEKLAEMYPLENNKFYFSQF